MTRPSQSSMDTLVDECPERDAFAFVYAIGAAGIASRAPNAFAR